MYLLAALLFQPPISVALHAKILPNGKEIAFKLISKNIHPMMFYKPSEAAVVSEIIKVYSPSSKQGHRELFPEHMVWRNEFAKLKHGDTLTANVRIGSLFVGFKSGLYLCSIKYDNTFVNDFARKLSWGIVLADCSSPPIYLQVKISAGNDPVLSPVGSGWGRASFVSKIPSEGNG